MRSWSEIGIPFAAFLRGFVSRKMFSVFKNIMFLGWLCGVLASLLIVLALWSFQLTANVAILTTEAAVTAVKHRKDLTKALAKARLRRVLVMIPVAGVAMGAYFEEQDYQEWKLDNPNRSRQEYGCEVALVTANLLDDVLEEIPNYIGPSKRFLVKQIPKCSSLE